jgi:hypothetical protein
MQKKTNAYFAPFNNLLLSRPLGNHFINIENDSHVLFATYAAWCLIRLQRLKCGRLLSYSFYCLVSPYIVILGILK